MAKKKRTIKSADDLVIRIEPSDVELKTGIIDHCSEELGRTINSYTPESKSLDEIMARNSLQDCSLIRDLSKAMNKQYKDSMKSQYNEKKKKDTLSDTDYLKKFNPELKELDKLYKENSKTVKTLTEISEGLIAGRRNRDASELLKVVEQIKSSQLDIVKQKAQLRLKSIEMATKEKKLHFDMTKDQVDENASSANEIELYRSLLNETRNLGSRDVEKRDLLGIEDDIPKAQNGLDDIKLLDQEYTNQLESTNTTNQQQYEINDDIDESNNNQATDIQTSQHNTNNIDNDDDEELNKALESNSIEFTAYEKNLKHKDRAIKQKILYNEDTTEWKMVAIDTDTGEHIPDYIVLDKFTLGGDDVDIDIINNKFIDAAGIVYDLKIVKDEEYSSYS